MLRRNGSPVRRGTEWFEVELAFEDEDTSLLTRLTPVGKPVPELVLLTWTRRHPHGWHRVTSGPHASRVIGLVKRADGSIGQAKAREIFDREHGALHNWASLLPGLRTAIENAQMDLPD